MPSITPSQALMLPADTPISDCVRRMRENNIGSVLVIRDTEHSPGHDYRRGVRAELVGIFTERDLVICVEEIRKGGYWDRPVSAVMTPNPLTLPVDRIDEAASLMLEKGFRHVPIVSAGSDGRETIAGVVSMRDLFRSGQSKLPASEARPVIGVLTSGTSPEGDALSALKADLRLVSSKAFESDPQSLGKIDAFLIDIDSLDPKTWPALLRKVNQAEGLPLAIVLLDPHAHDSKAVAALDRLNDAAKFAIFHKPVNLIELRRRLQG